MTLRPRTFTFYSYKGGVGRSMALLNVAYTLQSLGRHVLMMDLDLEAPGISGFLHRNDELAPGDEAKPDVLDLLTALKPALGRELGKSTQPELPALAGYLREVRPDKFPPAENPQFRRTRLDVLCASDERDYTNRLDGLHLSSLSAPELEDAGNLLRDILFRHRFPWSWVDGEPDEPTAYDYILIDSRTGFTETSGLCIGPLADRLLIFCGLNDQNINGTAEFLKVVGLNAGTRTVKWDDADDPADTSRAPALGEKPSLLIATPVPYGEMEMKKERLHIMEKKLGTAPAASISYHPRLSVMETVFCRDGADELITREYRHIALQVLALVGDHPGQLQTAMQPLAGKIPDQARLRRYLSLLDEDEVGQFGSLYKYIGDQLSAQARQKTGAGADAALAAAGDRYAAALIINPDFHDALNNWGAALFTHAKQKHGAAADALFTAAGEKFAAALAIKPDKHEALSNWGHALFNQAKQKQGAAADALFTAAGEKYAAALAIKPDKYEALSNWGNALSHQARQKQGAAAGELFTAAEEKYAAALAIKPDDHEALRNWGSSLSNQAQQKQGAEADALLSAAKEKYAAALAIEPDDHEAIRNWGISLSIEAQQKEGEEADALFTAAEEKYAAALAIEPDDHEALGNWGASLSVQAKQKQGAEADALFTAAGEKYAAALAIKPNYHEALSNWGFSFSAQAKQKQGTEADALVTAAGEKYAAALAIKPDFPEALYNLACLTALGGDAAGSLKWLEESKAAGHHLTQTEIAADVDFDRVRGETEFQAFVRSLPE